MASSLLRALRDTKSPRRSQFNKPDTMQYRRPRSLWPVWLLFAVAFASMTEALSIAANPSSTEALLGDRTVAVVQDGQLEEPAQRHEHSTIVDVDTEAPVIQSTATKQRRANEAGASPLPSPFDSSLAPTFAVTGNSACPSFINAFLTDPTFKQCYPVSTLLQTSKSFFDASKSLVSITQVLDASCSANVTTCSTYLKALAKKLIDPEVCGTDYERKNPIVTQAYLGMVSYEALYQATCLKDPDSSMYCYASAVTNLSTPSNVYFYYLPLNMTYPSTASPSCNTCLQKTMSIFHSAGANRKLPIANTYVTAAEHLQTSCGAKFVNNTLPAPVVSNAAPGRHSNGPSALSIALLLVAATCLLL